MPPVPPGWPTISPHHRVANIHSCSLFAGVAERCVEALTLTGAETVERDGEVLDAGE